MHYLYFWNPISVIFDAIVTPVFNWVFNHILAPVVHVIGEILGEALGLLYNNILEPILEEIVVFAIDLIWDLANSFFLELMFKVEAFILKIIDSFSVMFDVVMGVREVTIDGKSNDMLTFILERDDVKNMFLLMKSFFHYHHIPM